MTGMWGMCITGRWFLYREFVAGRRIATIEVAIPGEVRAAAGLRLNVEFRKNRLDKACLNMYISCYAAGNRSICAQGQAPL